MRIDLNADLGEGVGHDAELLSLVTSANVCCGAHAGDPAGIVETLLQAARGGVTIGAHPGYADREYFGRRDLDVPDADLFASLCSQVGGLFGLARACRLSGVDLEVKYLKPHGSLYNQAARSHRLAAVVCRAAAAFDLPVIGLPASMQEAVCLELGVAFVPEGFADRRYRPDGTLVPRTEPAAFVEGADEAVEQVEWLVGRGARTICVHGDNPHAVEFARAVRAALLERGHDLRPFVHS